MTLDGMFDGETIPEWFEPYHSDERAEWIRQEYNTSSAFLMGRETYEMLMPYWSTRTNNEMGVADALNQKPKYVVSSTMNTASWNQTTLIGANVDDEIVALKQNSGAPIRIIGSATLVQSLLRAGLIDELHLLVQPVLAGSGKQFFQDGMDMTALELVETRGLTHGVVLLHYRVTN
jgi:dihydrofolate reductase